MSSPLKLGINDLATTMPEVVAEWDYVHNGALRPCDVMAGSDKKVWWKCCCGHTWEAYVYSRKAGTGCPYCAGNAVLPGFNDLPTTNPDLLDDWDYEKNTDAEPEETAANTNRKVWWKCSLGHSWQATVSSRTAGKGCPICAGRQVVAGFNDLASRSSALADEWDYDKNGEITPESVTAYSHKKVWWKDALGHSWRAAPANRSNGNGCPFCAGRQVLAGFNDLASQYPRLAAQWNYPRNGSLMPDAVTARSNRMVWWVCQKGHEWKTCIYNRTKGDDCPICGNRTALLGCNDLETIHPDLAAEWNYEKNRSLCPTEVTYSSRRRVWWKCKYGHEWVTSVYNRHKGSSCPQCWYIHENVHTVIPGVNDLQTVSPWIAEQWDYARNDGLTPQQVRPYSTKKVWWKCENGHHWRSRIQTRQKGSGCPYCSKHMTPRSKLIT